MSRIQKISVRSLYMGKLKRGDDLLGAISVICRENNIRLGRVEAIGAVEKATLGYYDQKRKEYDFFTINSPHEITSLIGNISLRDEVPMVHAHLTLSDEKGNVRGGHLAPGCLVFACEVVIEAFEGPDFNRCLDEDTRLPLWKL